MTTIQVILVVLAVVGLLVWFISYNKKKRKEKARDQQGSGGGGGGRPSPGDSNADLK